MLDLDFSPMFTDTAQRGGITTIDVLVVCTGNICRSPLAAQLLRARMRGLDVSVGSAGTYGQVGEKMDRSAAKLALKLGVPKLDTREHRARWMTDFHLRGTDLVLTMTASHLERVVAMAPARRDSAFTVREFERLASALSDQQIRDAAEAAGPESHVRTHAALRLVAAQRATTAIAELDVIDPHRKSWPVFEESAAQMLPGLDQVSRVLRLALA